MADHLDIAVSTLVVGTFSKELVAIASARPDSRVVIAQPGGREDEAAEEFGRRVSFGPEAVLEAAGTDGHIVVNGIVGAAGLGATLAALEAGNRVALANKESLVAGGPLVAAARDRGEGELIPVDSEHSAIWQCLQGEDHRSVKRIILTASGGPFRGRTAEQLESVTVADALAHPTWSMGPRITIDSATLMNKAFEVIEAHFLFGAEYDNIEVVVHPESFVHSLVEFDDGVVKAEMGPPDMRKPIQHAITAPQRPPAEPPQFDLVGRTLRFEKPDRSTFPALDLGYRAGRMGGTAPAVLNASDEIAVAAFLDGVIPFTAIPKVVAHVLAAVPVAPVDSIADVTAADAEARAVAAAVIERSTA